MRFLLKYTLSIWGLDTSEGSDTEIENLLVNISSELTPE